MAEPGVSWEYVKKHLLLKLERVEAGPGRDMVPARGWQALGKGLDLTKEDVWSETRLCAFPGLRHVAHQLSGGSSGSIAAHLT